MSASYFFTLVSTEFLFNMHVEGNLYWINSSEPLTTSRPRSMINKVSVLNYNI